MNLDQLSDLYCRTVTQAVDDGGLPDITEIRKSGIAAVRKAVIESGERSETQVKAQAECILEWLKVRNYGELQPTFDTMTPDAVERMLGELREILRHGGRPPHWVKR
jgi:hypothetical protein